MAVRLLKETKEENTKREGGKEGEREREREREDCKCLAVPLVFTRLSL